MFWILLFEYSSAAVAWPPRLSPTLPQFQTWKQAIASLQIQTSTCRQAAESLWAHPITAWWLRLAVPLDYCCSRLQSLASLCPLQVCGIITHGCRCLLLTASWPILSDFVPKLVDLNIRGIYEQHVTCCVPCRKEYDHCKRCIDTKGFILARQHQRSTEPLTSTCQQHFRHKKINAEKLRECNSRCG